MLQKKIS